jgi:hypothetical protein
MSKQFIYNTEKYTIEDIVDFLISKWYDIDKNWKDSFIDQSKVTMNSKRYLQIKWFYIWINKTQKLKYHDWTFYYSNSILFDDSNSIEYKNHINAFHIWTESWNMDEYNKQHEIYKDFKKKNDKIYNMLKRKFWVPVSLGFAKFDISEKKESII